ncbi:MAG: hypothetical protein ABIP55_01585 [Tepidisphaeraceae bacterium]
MSLPGMVNDHASSRATPGAEPQRSPEFFATATAPAATRSTMATTASAGIDDDDAGKKSPNVFPALKWLGIGVVVGVLILFGKPRTMTTNTSSSRASGPVPERNGDETALIPTPRDRSACRSAARLATMDG